MSCHRQRGRHHAETCLAATHNPPRGNAAKLPLAAPEPTSTPCQNGRANVVREDRRVTTPESDLSQPSAVPSAVGWAELPDPVRRRLINWAADALGSAPADQVPVPLRRVAKFTPNKRAKLGAEALARAINSDSGFRGLVAAYVRADRVATGQPSSVPNRGPAPEPVAELELSDAEDASLVAADPIAVADPTVPDPTTVPDTIAVADPIAAAARAFLFTTPRAAELADLAGQAAEITRLRTEVSDLRTQLQRAQAAVGRAGSQKPSSRETQSATADDPEADKLRARLREQGTQMRMLRDQLAQAAAETANQVAELHKDLLNSAHDLKLMTDRAAAAKARADKAEAQIKELQSAAADGRAVADRRIELLLNTIRDAQTGLRRELRLGPNAVDPAEAVVTALPKPARSVTRSPDAALLANWLTLPEAHLIVDGYNITKTGYGDLTLADQRDRLVRALSALASRTGAEVTVVFDGAAVIGHQVAGRGVRVLFSPPGVIADEVIKRLVAAEPRGRVVIVASSDREIVTDVAKNGARTAPALVLLSLWDR